MLINVYILYFIKTENAKVWLYNSSHVTSSKVHTYHESNLFWFITLLKLFTKKRNLDFLRRRNRSKSYMYIVYMTDIWVSLWGRELCIGQGEGYNLCEAFLHVTLYGRHNRKGWWWWWCPPSFTMFLLHLQPIYTYPYCVTVWWVKRPHLMKRTWCSHCTTNNKRRGWIK